MKESVALAKDADAKKDFSSTRSDKSIHRVRNEPEMQLGSLRDVIGNITRDGGTPSVDTIATELSSMHTAQRASVLLALQRTHGNRYVQRVVAGIQAKLIVGQPGDIYEQEADRVADAVMRMPEPRVQRQAEDEEEEREKLSIQARTITPIQAITLQRQDEEEELKKKKKEEEEKEGKETIQTKNISNHIPEVTPDLESRIYSLREGGQPLPKSARAFFEPRFGADFSNVRVHNDARAASVARSVNARSFTLGRDVIFGAGEYLPDTSSGRKLLAHELTHVIQQIGTSQHEISAKLSGNVNDLRVTKVNGGVQRIMREVWNPQPAPPPCTASVIEVSGQLNVEFGPVPAGTENCVFTPLFHVAWGTSSISIQAQAASPPAGDWRVNVFECPWRSAGNDCSFGRSDNAAAAGPISSTLGINYNPTLWVSRNLLIRIRNGSTSPIQNVQLTLRPRAMRLDSVGEIIQAALDALGLIPGLGVVPDAVNAGFYLIKGNWAGAGISAAAMVPIFGQGAGITRLGVRVSRASIERLGQEGARRAIREGVERAGTRVLRRAPPERIIAAMRGFRSRIFRAGSETFQLDSRGMQHILERHHPHYWNGSVERTQSFLSEHLSVDDVADAINAVMSQNRQQLIRIGTTVQGQIRGLWGGVTYVLGLNRGRVGQFYPL